MLEDELRELLRELVHTTGAEAAEIASSAEQLAQDPLPAENTALGHGAVLGLWPNPEADRTSHAAALERTARAIRACARRWQATGLPDMRYARRHGFDRNRILERIRTYLQAFASAQGVTNAVLTVDGELLCAADDPDELQHERLPFLLKQVDAEVKRHKGETSHVELFGQDTAAFSFWIEACLIAFLTGDHAPDFVRHRARLVTREVGRLLPYLDDPPSAPAQIAPVPE